MKNIFQTMYRLAFLAALALSVSACSNSDDDNQTPTPTPAATVVFTSPTEHQTFAPGDTVRINGSITTAQQMHGYHITVKRVSDNLALDSMEVHFHGTQTNFAHKWKNTLTTAAELEVEVEVTLDHDGNVFRKSQHIHTTP